MENKFLPANSFEYLETIIGKGYKKTKCSLYIKYEMVNINHISILYEDDKNVEFFITGIIKNLFDQRTEGSFIVSKESFDIFKEKSACGNIMVKNLINIIFNEKNKDYIIYCSILGIVGINILET